MAGSRGAGPGHRGSARGLLVVGKGLSRGSTNRCLSRKSGESLPAIFESHVREAVDNSSCKTLSPLSSTGHGTPTELNSSWSGVNSGTTGLSTDRSSFYSWRDDEFDKANTQRVHQLLWEIDEMLFEGKVTSQSLREECADWVEQFPHIRVLGKQILLPNDEGFQQFKSSSGDGVDTKCLPGLRGCINDMKELCISGSKLIPTPSPMRESLDSSSTRISVSEPSMYSFLEEEIYDMDGKIEEYLAFDNEQIDDESWEQKRMHLAEKRTKHGIPPVSPDACIKDAVVSEVFDSIWNNVIGMLEELIKKNWRTSPTGCDKQVGKLKAATAKLPLLPAIRVTAGAGGVPLSKGSEARSGSLGSHFVSSQVLCFSSNFCTDLDGVMTIQAKPLQQRPIATADKGQNDQEDKEPRIGSSARNSVHTRLGRIADNSVLPSSRVLLSSSRKLPNHCRLPSLTSDQLSSKAPNMYNGEILRGTKLGASSDRLSSARALTTCCKLPPINSEAVEPYLSVPHLQQSSSDTPQKRSLTPLDFANHRGTGHGLLIGSQHHYKSLQRNPSTSRKRFQVTS